MVSRNLVQTTNAWLIRIEFFYTYSCVNGLCFGYFKIFPEPSPFDQKLRYPLLPMYPDFLTIRYVPKWRLFGRSLNRDTPLHSARKNPTIVGPSQHSGASAGILCWRFYFFSLLILNSVSII